MELTGGEEGCGTAKCPALCVGRVEDFRQAEIAEDDVTRAVEETVLRFEIAGRSRMSRARAVRQSIVGFVTQTGKRTVPLPVDDVLGVEKVEREDDLGDIEPNLVLAEPAPISLQMLKHLPAALVIHHQEQLFGTLEAEFESDEERAVVRLGEDGPFGDDLGERFGRFERRLADDFHRVDALGIALADSEHLAERTLPDPAEDLKVVDREFRGRLAVRGKNEPSARRKNRLGSGVGETYM